MGKPKRPKTSHGLGLPSLPSTSTTVAPSTSSGAPSTQTLKTKMHVSVLSASTMAPSIPATILPSTSNVIAPSTSLMTPSTPIPEIYDWTHSTITPKERVSFLDWARRTGNMAAYDERRRLYKWSYYIANIAAVPPPEEWIHATPTPEVHKRRFVKWAHSTSTVAASNERKRWSLQEEISRPFETALDRIQEEIKKYETMLKIGYRDSCVDLKQEHMIYSCHKGMHGVYQCENALWIWPKLRNSTATYAKTLSHLDGGPRDVGKKIKEKFPESDMIEGSPSINGLGLLTIKLSGNWIAKSIHKMIQDGGIDTWAPKLPVARVIVDYPSLDKEMHVDLFRRRAIEHTLINILKYSKVDVTIGHPTILTTRSKLGTVQEVLNRLFLNQERQVMDRDFNNASKDLLALWYGLHRADWMVYLTPVWKQEFIQMCFTAAKHKEPVKSNSKPARTSCAGYQSFTAALEDKILDEARIRVAAEQGEDAKLLGYTPEAVLDCVFTYACLKKHRLAECEFNIDDEMLKEEGNTFVYLLYTQAKIRRITDNSCEGINELKKASELILVNDEGWKEGEERMLGFHLLEFTEALQESCLSVLPHILCEYLYNLSKKFNRYYSCAHKVGSAVETSTLLLCEATAVVMEKCFHLLGITPTLPKAGELSVTPMPSRFRFSAAKQPIYLNARDLPRSSRFELFSLCTATATHYQEGDERDEKGKLFGLISISDNGLLSDGGSHFFEPDFAHVTLFNHDLCHPIDLTDWGIVYLGNPDSRRSVSFSSCIEVRMELYVAKNENASYQLCNNKVEIDLSDFWDKESDNACGVLTVSGEDGSTDMFYMILKDAVDATLEVKFETETPGRQLRGYVLAYYGDDFLYECQCLRSRKYNYMALLFRPNHALEAGEIQLIKSVLAVPTKGSLYIIAYLEDIESGEVIMHSSCKFKSQLEGFNTDTISGIDCQLGLKVDWKYEALYL